MALVNCVECNNQISTQAESCPKCGAPALASKIAAEYKNLATDAKKTRIGLKIAGGIIALLFFVGILSKQGSEPSNMSSASASDQNSEQTAPQAEKVNSLEETPTPVSTKRLFEDYQANEVAADAKYKGKLLAVRGVVQSINKDFTGAIWVGLKTPNDFMPVHIDGLSQDQTIKLAKGDDITATCVGNGMMMGSPMLKCSQ